LHLLAFGQRGKVVLNPLRSLESVLHRTVELGRPDVAAVVLGLLQVVFDDVVSTEVVQHQAYDTGLVEALLQGPWVGRLCWTARGCDWWMVLLRAGGQQRRYQNDRCDPHPNSMKCLFPSPFSSWGNFGGMRGPEGERALRAFMYLPR
jgi:hypothetical protein